MHKCAAYTLPYSFVMLRKSNSIDASELIYSIHDLLLRINSLWIENIGTTSVIGFRDERFIALLFKRSILFPLNAGHYSLALIK